MTARRPLRDIAVVLADRPGALADFGEALGRAGVGLEGGGVFTHRGAAIAHFLVDDADLAREVLDGHGPVQVSDVVSVRLDQDTPGQLGAFTRNVADAGISIRAQYSDHAGHLILVVAPHDQAACAGIARAWNAQRKARQRRARES